MDSTEYEDFEHPDLSVAAVREFVDSSDLGTEANPIVIEDDPAPLGSESNPIVIHVDEHRSYSETEQLSSDGDTETISESSWERHVDIAGRSTPIPVPTQFSACKDPEEPQASGQSSVNHLHLDGQNLEMARNRFYVEHSPSHEYGKGKNAKQRRSEQGDALKVEKPAKGLSLLETVVPSDSVGLKKRKSLHDEESKVRRSDRLVKRAMH
ncbi:hypothetical protein N7522_010550 [Penicillium canescens]|uniref:uncharacterized protein n=1 Tax=Penicillium canescens TaxID=5083 RepID=UPI0026DFB49F|nr:uncharacterized protein N7446_006138 [Penicillium canescens]KAJ5990343.1 hypothetical protein N7522_010550 [Penicillium canescens]KAJ6062018.1 hypothetical protein N7446_006138 [Penicillium canescens]